MPHSMWEKAKLCIPSGGVLSGWLVDHRPTVLPCNISGTLFYLGAVIVRWRRFQMKEWVSMPACVHHMYVCVLLSMETWKNATADLLLHPGVAGLLFSLCARVSLFILYNELFHVLYRKEFLKSWINFGIKVLIFPHMGDFYDLLYSKSDSLQMA